MGPRADLDRCAKSLPPTGSDHRTVQPVASRYTGPPSSPFIRISNLTLSAGVKAIEN